MYPPSRKATKDIFMINQPEIRNETEEQGEKKKKRGFTIGVSKLKPAGQSQLTRFCLFL